METSGHIEVLDEFLGLVKEALPVRTREQLKGQQKQELELWHAWNNNGRKPEHLQPLYESYRPLIQSKAKVYINRVEMPTSAIEAEFKKHFVNAVKTYNPTRGAQLSTWVTTNLQKAGRYVRTYQNLGKIPERQIGAIRKFDEARTELTQKFGHEPDTHSLADHLSWPHRRVVQMISERRADKPLSGYLQDPVEVFSPKELEAIHLLQYDSRLAPPERVVYEYTFGMNGRPMLRPSEIAKQTGLHPSKVSRVRNKLRTLTQDVLNTVG